MIKIGLLSDTHGTFESGLKEFFSDCSEIWHAGDIGTMEVIREISSFKPLKAVYGNIDGPEIRTIYPEYMRFRCEDIDVLMIHIGGYPGKYVSGLRELISTTPPDLLITGHSHILRVMRDRKAGFLFINPGAAGNTGIHSIRTAVRFTIDNKEIKDLEVIEW
jgi:putative phosphoesterase